MVTDAFLEEIKQSPKLPKYYDELTQLLASERERRERFYDEVRDDEKAEFINGEVIVHSPALSWHILTVRLTLRLIDVHVDKHKLGYIGSEKVFVSLTRNDYEPDIVFFGRKKAAKLKPDQNRFPAPDFIVEVLSPGTRVRDRGIKFEDNAAHGVSEYWILDPKLKILEQFILRNESYELELKSGSGLVTSVAINDLVLPIRALFDPEENLRALDTMFQKR